MSLNRILLAIFGALGTASATLALAPIHDPDLKNGVAFTLGCAITFFAILSGKAPAS